MVLIVIQLCLCGFVCSRLVVCLCFSLFWVLVALGVGLYVNLLVLLFLCLFDVSGLFVFGSCLDLMLVFVVWFVDLFGLWISAFCGWCLFWFWFVYVVWCLCFGLVWVCWRAALVCCDEGLVGVY